MQGVRSSGSVQGADEEVRWPYCMLFSYLYCLADGYALLQDGAIRSAVIGHFVIVR